MQTMTYEEFIKEWGAPTEGVSEKDGWFETGIPGVYMRDDTLFGKQASEPVAKASDPAAVPRKVVPKKVLKAVR